MPVPSALVTRFFQLLVSRRLTEAERELERLKQKMQKTEWNRGYFRALYGMFLSRKANGDNIAYTFFSKLDLSDKPSLHGYRREFLDHVRNRLHGDFDRGFFSAWADCMRVLSRMVITGEMLLASGNGAGKNGLETIKSTANQATIEGFLKETSDHEQQQNDEIIED